MRTEKHITNKISNLYSELKRHCQTRNERKTNKWKEKMSTYNIRVQETLFDVSALDSDRKKRLEKKRGVQMTETEFLFLENQKTTRTS